MSAFGLELMTLFLEQVVPDLGETDTEFAQWEDVQKLFFSVAKHVREQAHSTGRSWATSAPIELDRYLIDLAKTGRFDGVVDAPAALMEELWRRWSWALIGSSLEMEAGNRLDLPLPKSAPPAARGWAVVLFVLGGPARDYRLDALPQ